MVFLGGDGLGGGGGGGGREASASAGAGARDRGGGCLLLLLLAELRAGLFQRRGNGGEHIGAEVASAAAAASSSAPLGFAPAKRALRVCGGLAAACIARPPASNAADFFDALLELEDPLFELFA